ncbi:MAG: group II truncated hemoglobin [Actinomycetota bacterium]|nr:group II truncated hemoglobin [Actinomycetota bacterium]
MLPGPKPAAAHPWGDADTPYEEIGGDAAVRQLVEAFYDIIEEESPVLRAMLPKDTSGSRDKLYEYLSGWLGGPSLYVEKRGHPRLRMRHAPFSIGDEEAGEWMRCMSVAIDRVGIDGPLEAFLHEKLDPLARHMINR